MAGQKKQSGGPGCLGLILAGAVFYFITHGIHLGTTTYSLAQTRADFRRYVGQVNGVLAECDNATTIAKRSLQSATRGGDTLQAYQDAQAAHDLCNQAMLDNNQISVPESLGSYNLGDDNTDIQTYTYDWQQYWNDAKTLLQNPADLSAQSDAKSTTDDANTRVINIVGRQFTVAEKLGIKHVEKIAAIAPSH